MKGIRKLMIGLMLVVVGFSWAGMAGAQDTGKQVQKVLAETDKTLKSVEGARAQLQETLDLYNSIIQQQAKNPESTYKKLSSAADKTKKSIEATRKSSDSMHTNIDKLFQTWEQDLEAFSNEDLKAKSQARLEAAKERYGQIDEGMEEARKVVDTFLSDLNDNILYLGSNLNPTGIEDLQDEAEKLNTTATEIFEKADAFVAKIKENQAAMSPGTAQQAKK